MKNFTKTFSFVLISLLCSLTASAYDIEVNGIYYNILSREDLTVEVTKGDKKYTGNVVIPSTVTYDFMDYDVSSIGDYAFDFCYNLTSIEIPNSVTRIGKYSFQDCSNLISIIIPKSVTSIERGAFFYCSNLDRICVSDSNPKYDSRNNCNAIIETETNTLILGCKNTIIPNTITSIGESAFGNCSSLTNIEIPNSVTSIGNYAFWACSGLTSIKIPNSVTNIKYNAFNDCYNLTSIEIPKSVTSIGTMAFSGCYNLDRIYVDESNPIFDSRNKCNAIIETETNSLIFGCKNTTIPNTVTSIADGAFWFCSSLTSIEIGNSVTSIGDCAFWGCSNLISIEISNSVTSIGGRAFEKCSSLTSIYMQGTTPPSVGSNNFSNNNYLNTTLYIPNGSLSAYQSADTWKEFQNIKEYDATGIDDISADNMEIKFTGNGISVPNAVDKAVYVYSVNGAVVEKLSHYDGGEILLGKGTYIIRIGEKAIKVQL